MGRHCFVFSQLILKYVLKIAIRRSRVHAPTREYDIWVSSSAIGIIVYDLRTHDWGWFVVSSVGRWVSLVSVYLSLGWCVAQFLDRVPRYCEQCRCLFRCRLKNRKWTWGPLMVPCMSTLSRMIALLLEHKTKYICKYNLFAYSFYLSFNWLITAAYAMQIARWVSINGILFL